MQEATFLDRLYLQLDYLNKKYKEIERGIKMIKKKILEEEKKQQGNIKK